MTYGLKEAHDELLSELDELREKYAEVCQTSAMLRADMAAARERQAKLRAENAELRREIESIGTAAYLYGRRDLKAENKKLRELVMDMFNCISHANGQDWFYFEHGETGCGMSCVVNGEGCGLLVLADRMRELGMGV